MTEAAEVGQLGTTTSIMCLGIVDPISNEPRTRHRRSQMKAIVVTDEAAGTAAMTLVQRPEPPAAINDVIVEVHASGFVPTETAWSSTWTDRRGADRAPSIP